MIRLAIGRVSLRTNSLLGMTSVVLYDDGALEAKHETTFSRGSCLASSLWLWGAIPVSHGARPATGGFRSNSRFNRNPTSCRYYLLVASGEEAVLRPDIQHRG